MESDLSLTRKAKARHNKPLFYHEYNDIDIYIEDTEKIIKKVYIEILTKALNKKYKISNVFPLGGRAEVLTECENDQSDRERDRIYIIDGDLHLITEENNFNLKRLLVLDKYCIENYLIDENSIIEFLYEEDETKSREKLRIEFNMNDWIQKNKLLVELFIVYALSKKYTPTEQTVAYKISKLISSDSGCIDNLKVQTRIDDVKKIIINKIGTNTFNEEFKHIERKYKTSENILDIVSGKDYLLPLIIFKMKRTTTFKHEKSKIKFRLAKNSNVTYFEKIIELACG